MSISWIHALVRASAALRGSTTEEGRVIYAVSLLVEGRIDQYAAAAVASGLPANPADTPDNVSIEATLTRGLLLLRQGDPKALPMLSEAAAYPDRSDLAFAATILLNMALSDAGRPDLALDVLGQN